MSEIHTGNVIKEELKLFDNYIHTKKKLPDNSINYRENNYLDKILKISKPYLLKELSETGYKELLSNINGLSKETNTSIVIQKFSEIYCDLIKKKFRSEYKNANKELTDFINKQDSGIKIIWGDCYKVLKGMESESIQLMVTSPPYYNAREYSQWNNLDEYLQDMRMIIKESYRVLDNHRVWIWNVGDIFDNDNLSVKSVWGKRRLPLGAYFIKIFEEEGFTFVDDFIWDKGEVQSERHKNGNNPYPFYQYPANCYEHLLVFHKHRLDKTKYPCPVCGCLKVNGNSQPEIGIQSWECKNYDCFERSEGNRGKRFSYKTNITQSHHLKEHEIPKDFINKWRKDIVKFSPVIKINSKGVNTLGHTAPFPTDIPEFAIRMFTYEGEKVLDPFGGSFTSGIVAKKLNRTGICIELNKNLFRKASIENIFKNLNITNISEFNYE